MHDRRPSGRLWLVIASNGMLRVAGGASSVLVGVYIAELATSGLSIGAGLVGALAAVSFGAELAGAVPLGMLSDRVSARTLMTGGALLAAVATLVFGLTRDVGVFVVSRALEGLAAAAGVPALLAHLTDATAHDHRLRAKAMSYFELSLLAGLALGGIVGGRLWAATQRAPLPRSHSCTSSRPCCSSWGASGVGVIAALKSGEDCRGPFATPQLRQLAPVWLCMNAILGLWLGPTLYFLLTNRSDASHRCCLACSPTIRPDSAGCSSCTRWCSPRESLVWSRVLPGIDLRRAFASL